MASYHERVGYVDDEHDLVALARDYLASWPPEVLAIIPEAARPAQVKGIDDLAYWHQQLVECYCTGGARGAESEMVRNMLQFFALAVQRAAELEAAPAISGHEAAVRLFSDRSVPSLFTSAMNGPGEG